MNPNDRRKTLAGLSPSHMNASLGRPGFAPLPPGAKPAWAGTGPSAPPVAPRPAPDRALARMSLAGPVVRRPGGAGAPPARAHHHAPGAKADPRPLGDKAFQAACVRTVIAYLAAHGYEHPVTPKTLASPTTKDFANVMAFLVRQLDPALHKTLGKLEEEVPALFKRLRYPFQVSRSNLTAVGSPHTWPAILAALTWTCELLTYAERAAAARGPGGGAPASERAAAEAGFFAYVADSYRHFMAGEDERCAAVDAAAAADVRGRQAEVEAEAARLGAAAAALRERVAAARAARGAALAAAAARAAEAAADRDKFRRLLDNLAAHRAALERKIAERGADVAAQQRELAAAEAEADALAARVAAQPVQPADVRRLTAERARHEGAAAAAAGARAAADARAAAAAADAGARLDAAAAALDGYHAAARRLALLPATAKRAAGVAFEVRLDRGGGSAAELAGRVDVKGALRPALERLRAEYAARARELGGEALSLRERRDAAAEARAERAEEAAAAEAALRRLEAAHRAAREALEAEEAAAAARLEALAGEVSALRGAGAAAAAESEAALRALQADADELAAGCEAEAAALHRDLAAALEAVLNHKLAVQGRLRGAHAGAAAALDALRAAPPAAAALGI